MDTIERCARALRRHDDDPGEVWEYEKIAEAVIRALIEAADAEAAHPESDINVWTEAWTTARWLRDQLGDSDE